MTRAPKGFSLLEVIIVIGLLAGLLQALTTSAFALTRSITRTNTQSTLEDEGLLLLDEVQHRQPISKRKQVSIDRLTISSSTPPSFQIDIELSATTTQGQPVSTHLEREIWPTI